MKKNAQTAVKILGMFILIGLSSSTVSAFNLIKNKEQVTQLSINISQQKLTNKRQNFGRLQGLWLVDYQRTLEEARKNPEISEEEIEQMPKLIERLIQTMQIEITENSLIYRRGTRETVIPCSVKETTTNQTVALCNAQGEAMTITFTLIDNKYMNFKSSHSDDMDYYIWKRAE